MADKNYSEAGFFQKLNTFARIAGHDSGKAISTTLLCRRVTRHTHLGQEALSLAHWPIS